MRLQTRGSCLTWKCAATVLAVLFAGGCGAPADKGPAMGLRRRVGSECTIQFRRDALGAAAALPISPETTGINGANVVLQGKLLGVDGDWLHVESTIEYREGSGGPPREIRRDYEVPVHSVLYLEFQKAGR